ncbi:flavodoxin domain-containing protein [Pengzhenrongella sp.]|jgi:flavodoxin|uniref:flavodoxin domain-containing protein n=1 Tax=Pengzhenrongella sp. TaxID=2888820 RepID=UPI002F954678
MRALVVYESMFGNTRDIAQAVADGMSAEVEVEVVEVGAAPEHLDAEVGLLVVGGQHVVGQLVPLTADQFGAGHSR